MPLPAGSRSALPTLVHALCRTLAATAAVVLPVVAQTLPEAGSAASPSPTPQPSPSEPRQQRVEITGGRTVDMDERRQSTAAKIVVGREEIERFGDSTLADVLKRLPGVSAPGGGRGIRMRGLGAGYTQILIDGERMPPGFSLESLNPEQVERIEILRAPTAETGTRAMAGTINIITREGFVKRLNDVNLGLGVRHGKVGGMASWTRNGGGERFSHNVSLSLMRPGQTTDSLTTTTRRDLAGASALVQREHTQAEDRRTGVHATARLQWRIGEQGDSLTLTPFLMRWQGGGHRDAVLSELVGTPEAGDAAYDTARTDFDNRFTLVRMSGQWRHSLPGGVRMDGRATLGDARSDSRNLRREFDEASRLRETDDETVRSHERSASVSLKASRVLKAGHTLVAGLEAERARREEAAHLDGQAVLPESDNLKATTGRLAAYAQDEWNVTPRLAAHVGLRWEGIRTISDAAGVATDSSQGAPGLLSHRNRSSVLTPVLHGVWKFDENKRDQLRASLTRSYKSPTVQQLVARPSPTQGTNNATRPDRVGNPTLQPELATGIDIALERYLEGGGVLSANVFHRRITDLIRTVTTLQPQVPWTTGPRWVARPENLGRAVTQGVELEAKFRLPQVIAGAPNVDLRVNASVFRSRVDDVPGPDNRLDQQPEGTLNLGADHRLRGLPLMVGGSVGYTPGYATRLSATQRLEQSRQRVFDAYAAWTFSPTLRLRLSGSNIAARDEASVSAVGLQTAETVSQGFTTWQARLEIKL